MFGAYQAGAWIVLSEHWQPDIVVGASIGAVNGWAIAAGLVASDWVRQWKEPGEIARHRWRFPRSIWDGILDARPFERYVRNLTERCSPRCDYGLVVTELRPLSPRLYVWPELNWRHVVASCSLPGVYPQQRIGARRSGDGGLLGALPVWAAAELGATHILGIGLLGTGPAWRGARPPGVKTAVLEPSHRLGGYREMMLWSDVRVEQFLQLGAEEARQNISRLLRFESQ